MHKASPTSQFTSPVSSTYEERLLEPRIGLVGLGQEIDQPRPDHRAVSPTIQHTVDVERLVVVRQQIEPLANRLHHAEFDPIVDELYEVAGAGRAGMDIAAIRREGAQQRLDMRHCHALAADHKAGSVASAFDTAGRSHVDELSAFRLTTAMAAHRVAPIRVAPIRDNIAGLQRLGQADEDVIDGPPCRNVQQHHARRLQLLAKRGELLNLDKTRLFELIGRAIAGQANDAESFFERLESKSAAHLAKADHTKFTAIFHGHRRSTSTLGDHRTPTSSR
jgi:hypothetical protein